MTTNTQNSARLLTEMEVAELLSIESTTLRRWRWSGRGPRFRKLGAAVRYHPNDVSAFIDAASRTSTTDTGKEVM